jgi:hypothetical protein
MIERARLSRHHKLSARNAAAPATFSCDVCGSRVVTGAYDAPHDWFVILI